jgi:bacteriocin biosynthesis cyclodehydratase domain-containing protein
MEPADLMLVSFKRHLRVETIPAEAVCLFSERGVTALSGSSIERLAPMLDGSRTVAQVKQELSAYLSAGQVTNLLDRLSDAGLITYYRAEDAERAGDEAARAYWSLADVDPDGAAMALAYLPVEIIAMGSTDPGMATAACRSAGLSVSETRDGAAFSLVLCDDYLDPALSDINARQFDSRRPWLLAKPCGASTWVGPVFRPGSGPCWACLAKRLAGSRVGGFLTRSATDIGTPVLPLPAALPTSIASGLQIALLETAKWLAGVRYDGQDAIYILDTLALCGGHHAVRRRPQCPVCGDPDLVAARTRQPVVTMARRPAAAHGNGQRACSPAEVLAAYGHLIDPVTGVVAELRRDPACPPALHAYVSGRNRAMAESSVTALRAGLRAKTGGKGATDIEAKTGALCEAVERYCGTLDGDELRITDSYRGLGDKAIHPDTCQLFHPRQFADRARWNATCAGFHRVPEPFSDQAVMDWTPLWSLLAKEHKLLPTAMLYFKPDAQREPMSVYADSNGNAAGSSPEDAILQGFFELVERDAVALWWYNRTRQPAVSLDSFGDEWADVLPATYRRLNRKLWVLDVTSDLGVPAMAAISRRTDKVAEDIMLGFGAHFDPRIALRRALSELGQMLCAVADAPGDGGGYALRDPHLVSWWSGATVHKQSYLLPDPARAPLTADDYGYRPSPYLDLDRVCTIVADAGLDILVLDQTRPDIELPVVKVVVPGLRHYWPRLAQGRLYDVPVRLGRLAEPTRYENLNPIPMYL